MITEAALDKRVKYVTENEKIHFVGSIIEIDSNDEEKPYLVEWDNGKQSWYAAEELGEVE
jgi:hypothetical protein